MSCLRGVASNASWSLDISRTDFRALREVSLGRSAKRNPKNQRAQRKAKQLGGMTRHVNGGMPGVRHVAEPKDRGRESASSPSLRTGQALFTHQMWSTTFDALCGLPTYVTLSS